MKERLDNLASRKAKARLADVEKVGLKVPTEEVATSLVGRKVQKRLNDLGVQQAQELAAWGLSEKRQPKEQTEISTTKVR